MISLPFDSIVSDFKAPFMRALSVKNMHAANLIAMEAASLLFEHDPSLARTAMWGEFFAPLAKRYRAPVPELCDFEVVDYQLYALPQSWSLVRGPKPRIADISSGRYLTFSSAAAQLFGRYQNVSPPALVAEALGLACLNLSTGGSGSRIFRRRRNREAGEDGGKAVVVQILSGQSIGCDEYPRHAPHVSSSR